jgi:hypothetical protein
LAGGARSGVLQELEIILRNCHAALRGESPQFAVVPDSASLRPLAGLESIAPQSVLLKTP